MMNRWRRLPCLEALEDRVVPATAVRFSQVPSAGVSGSQFDFEVEAVFADGTLDSTYSGTFGATLDVFAPSGGTSSSNSSFLVTFTNGIATFGVAINDAAN